MAALTVKGIASARPEKKQRRIADAGSGLYLRIEATGNKFFDYRFTDPRTKARRWHSLGPIKGLTLEQARDKVRENKSRLKVGIDPATSKLQAFTNEAEAVTLNQAWDAYADDRSTRKRQDVHGAIVEVANASLASECSAWDLHVRRGLGPIKIKDLSRLEVKKLHKKMTKEKHIPVQADRVVSLIVRAINQALDDETYDGRNRAEKIKQNEAEPITRIVEAHDLASLYNNCVNMRPELMNHGGEHPVKVGDRKAAGARAVGLVIRMLMLSGQRTNEILNLHDGMIVDGGEWVDIHKHNMKGKAEHRFPLLQTHREIIDEALLIRDRFAPASPYIFINPATGTRLTEKAISHRIRVRGGRKKNNGPTNFELWGVPKFTPHDLRRSYRTYAAELGIDESIMMKLTAHTRPGDKINKIYIQSKFDKEKRRAALRLEQFYREHIGLPTLPAAATNSFIVEEAAKLLGITAQQLQGVLPANNALANRT